MKQKSFFVKVIHHISIMYLSEPPSPHRSPVPPKLMCVQNSGTTVTSIYDNSTVLYKEMGTLLLLKKQIQTKSEP